MYVQQHVCAGQRATWGSYFAPTMWSWGLDSGHQVGQQAPVPPTPQPFPEIGSAFSTVAGKAGQQFSGGSRGVLEEVAGILVKWMLITYRVMGWMWSETHMHWNPGLLLNRAAGFLPLLGRTQDLNCYSKGSCNQGNLFPPGRIYSHEMAWAHIYCDLRGLCCSC